MSATRLHQLVGILVTATVVAGVLVGAEGLARADVAMSCAEGNGLVLSNQRALQADQRDRPADVAVIHRDTTALDISEAQRDVACAGGGVPGPGGYDGKGSQRP